MTDPTVIKQVSANKCFNGTQFVYEHSSAELKCDMKFAVYLPESAKSKRLPVLIWLSGLTCNEQNFITKSGFQRLASQHEIVVVCPDTSPRGVPIEGDSERYDFGVGAGFYVNATEPKWSTNYRMYSYVNDELHQVIKKNFNNNEEQLDVSIFGHSMGGHGALISFLKNPGKYRSVSAFAPIVNPVNCPWGQNAFTGYLGSDKEKWNEYDATCLVKKYSGEACRIFIDQGSDDQFLKQDQLLSDNIVAASKENSAVQVDLRYQDGFDHSYYFIASFVEDHFNFHKSNFSK